MCIGYLDVCAAPCQPCSGRMASNASEIVAAGWAAEEDEELIWAPGDDREVTDWTEIININVWKKEHSVQLILFLTAFDLLVAGGTHKGTGSFFQRDQSALYCCAWGTSPLFQALLPCQTLLGALTFSKFKISLSLKEGKPLPPFALGKTYLSHYLVML